MGMRVEMLLLGLVVGLCLSVRLEAQLQVGFYKNNCPNAESIVREEVSKAFDSNRGIAAGLVRMHFHDCFVRGCDGSVLILTRQQQTQLRRTPLLTILAFEGLKSSTVQRLNWKTVAKDKFHVQIYLHLQQEIVFNCRRRNHSPYKPSTGWLSGEQRVARLLVGNPIYVSPRRPRIDSWTGGLGYPVPAGRRDGRISVASESLNELPGPTSDVATLTQIFARKGFTQEEMVTLSGAHTIGRSHCTSFSNRLYSFNTTASQDPSLDTAYGAQLKQQCPQGSKDTTLVVPMNPSSPNFMDTAYYVDILANRGLFTSDQTLLTDTATASQVRSNAFNGLLWRVKFAAAMGKMGKLDVLTGTAGEIRSNCRVIN